MPAGSDGVQVQVGARQRHAIVVNGGDGQLAVVVEPGGEPAELSLV
jgi:hypothetical protein